MQKGELKNYNQERIVIHTVNRSSPHASKIDDKKSKMMKNYSLGMNMYRRKFATFPGGRGRK